MSRLLLLWQVQSTKPAAAVVCVYPNSKVLTAEVALYLVTEIPSYLSGNLLQRDSRAFHRHIAEANQTAYLTYLMGVLQR